MISQQEKGYMAVKDGKAFGVTYEDAIETNYGFVEMARGKMFFSKEQFSNFVRYTVSSRYKKYLKAASLVPVIRNFKIEVQVCH
jgi:hypothetical protein